MNSNKRKIERIATNVAEKITTAQVVGCLSGAVRQLIDNSIDANSTIIDVRAKNNGFDAIEVQDNGHGIDENNFEMLCKPHSTSKLSDYSDFDNLSTLGFRGEALNALCALSNVSIFTRSCNSELGTRLKFDHSGNIMERQRAARQNGTTVIIEKLFECLPVRRKEFERTARKDFMQLLTAIQSFALMCPNIRFIVSNVVAGRKNQNIICTPGGNSKISDVVENLFGISSKIQKSPLIEIIKNNPNEEILLLHSIPKADDEIFDLIGIKGFISSCEHGSGRSTSDRQFIYINNRPVDYSRVSSVVNDVYKTYNKTQFPIFVLFIEVPGDKIDVNITPDKRTVMFEKEKHLLALIRASILGTLQTLLGSHSTVRSSVEDTRNLSILDTSICSSQTLDDTWLNSSQNSVEEENESLPNVVDLIKSNHRTPISEPMPKKSCRKREENNITLDGYTVKFTPLEKTGNDHNKTIRKPENINLEDNSKIMTENVENVPCRTITQINLEDLSKGFEDKINTTKDNSMLDQVEADITSTEREKSSYSDDDIFIDEAYPNDVIRPQQKIKFSMNVLRRKYKKLLEIHKDDFQADSNEFSAKICPDNNEEAERQLDRALRKNDFNEMRIIGQFNHGFIITELRDHLFIIDQHASDEKYNFERLQSKAKLTKQPLLTPVALNYGAVQEMIIRDNIEIFRANGFDFMFRDLDGYSKTLMTARPELLSKHLTDADLEEIVAMLSEYPNQMYRPIKIRQIFASRACRKSIMIGKPLNHREMTRVVRNLSKLLQPWNCPHGRPTIRHLFSMCNWNN